MLSKVLLFTILFQISGMLYFSAKVAQALLLLSSEPPLDCCTYLGLDSGAQPLQVSYNVISLWDLNLKPSVHHTNTTPVFVNL